MEAALVTLRRKTAWAIDAAEGSQLGDGGFERWLIVRASSASRLIVSTFAGGAFACGGLAPVGGTQRCGVERLLGCAQDADLRMREGYCAELSDSKATIHSKE